MEETKVPALAIMEERKLREIEHSRRRRKILQGYERHIESICRESVEGGNRLIRDQEGFKRYFSNLKYYSIIESSEQYQREWIRTHCPGKRVLDYCCGSGEDAIFAAQCGAELVGIDISPEGIANARQNAADAGVDPKCQFAIMDAEATEFPDNHFDIVTEYGSLHHLDFDRAMRELCRIMKPDGQLMGVEALRHNPFIHLYRKLTPHLRTGWEVDHILTVHHLERARAYFGEVHARFFHLAALAAVPFRNTRVFPPLRQFLDRLDRVILQNHRIGRYAWIMVFTLAKPQKPSGEPSAVAAGK